MILTINLSQSTSKLFIHTGLEYNLLFHSDTYDSIRQEAIGIIDSNVEATDETQASHIGAENLPNEMIDRHRMTHYFAVYHRAFHIVDHFKEIDFFVQRFSK